MNVLKIDLTNCYGIQSLKETLDFSDSITKAYAIYAPNGLMKTSFTKTFEALAKGDTPKEERYNRTPQWAVKCDGTSISKEMLYVLKAEIDISSDSPAMTDILVDPKNKARYDELLVDLDKLKKSLTKSLQKVSRVKQNDIEKKVLDDWSEANFLKCIEKINAIEFAEDLGPYVYDTIFDPKSIEVLKSEEFISKAKEFNDRYQELFEETGTIYQKGVFNPTRAATSFTTLGKQGFFAGGHRVHLRGESTSVNEDELKLKLEKLHLKIDGDETLKKIRISLAKNAQTDALTDLLESLSSTQVEFLLEKIKPENQKQFRKELWTYYIKNCQDATAYLGTYNSSKTEIESIEAAAALSAPKWTNAINLFNSRFQDMPFKLSLFNQAQASLGKEEARLKFTFTNGPDKVEWARSEVKTLSQGETRALYLLNFIFEVEALKLTAQETLFIIDDAADSFDYKNKHAIVQYLKDLNNTPNFHQIILTHNFDFFRTLANSSFVHRDRCLMANRNGSSISFAKAEGVTNYFIGKWKDHIIENECILCATIPFTRNLIEYTKGVMGDYLTLTSLLHWKNDTKQITIGQYLVIYNNLFGKTYDTTNTKLIVDLLFEQADIICNKAIHEGLNLEDKVLLCIAIRIQSEIFLTNELRKIKGDNNFWCLENSPFGKLLNEFSTSAPSRQEIKILEKVSITVSSNIHLNSFMYEPILDLTIEHLIALYNEVSDLNK